MIKVLLMMTLTYSLSARAADWYVDATNGSDSNTGANQNASMATIQAAIDVASNGDTIYVMPGIYAPISTGNKSIAIRGVEGANDTIIDGCGNSRCVTASNTDVEIYGFLLRNGNCDAGGGNVVRGTYYNCVLLNGRSDTGGGGNASQAILINCLIKGGRAVNGGNIIGSLARNCTIVDGYATNNGGAFYNCALYNCICYNNDSSWRWGNDNGTSYTTGSSYWGNDPGGNASCEQKNVFKEDPLFVDAANGDYRLQSGSPCINAGNDEYVQTNEDILGNIRIADGAVDLGAYEFIINPDAVCITVNFILGYSNAENIVRSYEEGSKYYSLPAPSRIGYHFSGWFTAPSGGAQVLAGSDVNSSITTLYARWTSYTEAQRMALDIEYGGVLSDNGTSVWRVDDSISHKGGSSLKSAEVSHSQSTYEKLTVNGTGTVSFWWKVSSESNYDKLSYYVDGSLCSSISGTRDWSQITVSFDGDGDHEIKWVYSKDSSVNSGSDCGWIDDVVIEMSGEKPSDPETWMVAFNLNGIEGEMDPFQVQNGMPYGVLPSPPDRNGFSFLGWFTAADGGVRVDKDTVVDESVTVLYAHWQRLDPIQIISSKVREDDASVLDVVYRINSSNSTANVRMLVFEDGEMSFSKVVRPETFADGTEVNVGHVVPANTNLLVSWHFTADWDVKLARVKVMILLQENYFPVPLDVVVIPENGGNKRVEFSTNEIAESTYMDALYWLYASKDDGLVLADGVLSSEGIVIARGSELVYPNVARYVFKSMGYALLEGESLRYVNETARLSLSPEGSRQYAVRQD